MTLQVTADQEHEYTIKRGAADKVCTAEKSDLKKLTCRRISCEATSTSAWLDNDAINAYFAALVRAKNSEDGYTRATAPAGTMPPFVVS